LKNIFAFYAKFNDAFERVENLKREDKKCDWATEFVPEWLNCIAITKISTIRVVATDAHTLAIAKELAGYYKPVTVEESGRYEDLEPHWAQKKSEIERRKRWRVSASPLFAAKGK